MVRELIQLTLLDQVYWRPSSSVDLSVDQRCDRWVNFRLSGSL
jgi:hypothetical protein